MSNVTNVILTTFIDEHNALAEVNKALAEAGHSPLISCADPRLPQGWYGGDKFLEVDIFIGAYNNLNVPHLVKACKAAPWDDPGAVALFIRGQWDDCFKRRF